MGHSERFHDHLVVLIDYLRLAYLGYLALEAVGIGRGVVQTMIEVIFERRQTIVDQPLSAIEANHLHRLIPPRNPRTQQ